MDLKECFMKIQERNYGIDLLRILSMFMIVILHVLGRGGILGVAEVLSVHYEVAWLLEIFCYGAVNMYALISGYVGVNSKYKLSNIITLWLQVFFYTFFITIIFMAFKIIPINFGNILKAFLPVSTKAYWYFTAYFVLFFTMPMLNKAVKELEEKHLKLLVYGGMILFSLIPTIFMTDIFGTSSGYSAIWLIYLYILGAYVKEKEERFNKITPHFATNGFLILILLTWLSRVVIEFMTLRIFNKIFGSDILISYTSPTILISSILFLCYFKNISLSEKLRKVVSFLTPMTFGVYLIHVNPLVWEYIMKRYTP